MSEALLVFGVFAIFIPALILPGPDFVAVARAAMSRGRAAGIATAFGVTLGLGFYATLSLLGLSALLVEHQWLTWAIRVLGGAYLIYLGITLLLTLPEAIRIEEGAAPSAGPGRAAMFGFLVTLTNPKAIVLFASVFATAVDATTPIWLMGLMIALVMLTTFVWYAVVASAMASRPVLSRFEGARHWIERLAGVSFIAIGGRVMADARNPVQP